MANTWTGQKTAEGYRLAAKGVRELAEAMRAIGDTEGADSHAAYADRLEQQARSAK